MDKEHSTDLSPAERAAHYRDLARETEAMGEHGSPELEASCRRFAILWRKLADEIESAEIAALEKTAAGHDSPRSDVISAFESPPGQSTGK